MRRETKRTFELVRKVLLTGSEITEDDGEFLRRNPELFANFKFKKVRRADPKWRLLLNNKKIKVEVQELDNDIIRGTFEVDLNTGITKYNLTSTHTIKQERIKSLEDFLENTVAEVNVDKRLTTEQRKKIWCILDDFAYCN